MKKIMENKYLMWAAVLIMLIAVLIVVSLAVGTGNGSSASTSTPSHSSTTTDNSSTTSSNDSFEDSSSESSSSLGSNGSDSTTDNSSTTSSNDSFEDSSSESSSSSNSYDSDSTTDNSSSQESIYAPGGMYVPRLEANTWYVWNEYTPLKFYNCAVLRARPISESQSVIVEFRPACANCHYVLTGEYATKKNIVSPENPQAFEYYCRFCGATSVARLEVVY